ncbi:OmpA family protein [Leisingera sp. NJS201]|uniref:OmpA family protein n=1 Tax=Leisingera sp. NJS201 TaxID=2508306 RepID=UPI001070C3F5|nr:OmpA family protein [Leisingera sp. NJS201]QBR36612.1 OmpA family protein [Leisingera sp. NJS201]
MSYTLGQMGGMQTEELMRMIEQQRIGSLVVISQPLSSSYDLTSSMAETAVPPSEPRPQINVFFEFGSASIGSSQLPVIRTVCSAMGEMGGGGFDLIGHSDSAGERDYNDVLSLRRAISVRRAMEKECNVTGKGISVAGAGARTPLEQDDPEGGMNRRVEIRAAPVVQAMTATGAMTLLQNMDTPGIPASNKASNPDSKLALRNRPPGVPAPEVPGNRLSPSVLP